MNIQEKSKIEYRSRINRVMDYIDIHLDQPLELKSIAEIENRKNIDFTKDFDDNWDFFIENDKKDFGEHAKKIAVDFQAIYQENFS